MSLFSLAFQGKPFLLKGGCSCRSLPRGRGNASRDGMLASQTFDKLFTTHFACVLLVQLCFLHTQIWPESSSTQGQLLSGQFFLLESPPFQRLGSRLKQREERALGGWGLRLTLQLILTSIAFSLSLVLSVIQSFLSRKIRLDYLSFSIPSPSEF